MEKKGSFEETIKELEKIATELGLTLLNEHPLKYARHPLVYLVEAAEQCNDLLENAEKRITILLKDGEETKEESFVQEEE